MSSNPLLAMIGNTPILPLTHLDSGPCELFVKLENQNPGGSIKDRIALTMIEAAEKSGQLQPGGTIIEATAGNTGLGLALVAAQKGYHMLLVVPDKMSREKIFHLKALGAEVRLTRSDVGKGHPDYYQDLARSIAAQTPGAFYIDQFNNPANAWAHESGTGPEIWRQTQGQITHFISSMGTTGTIMGVSRYLKEQNPAVQIVGLQPMEGASIPGIRRWPEEYLPSIYQAERVDRIIDMDQREAEDVMRRLAREEGIFCGVSSGGAVAAMLRLSAEVENAVMVAIICDRGDRYLSTGVYDTPHA